MFIINYDIIRQGWWDETEQFPGLNIIEINDHKISINLPADVTSCHLLVYNRNWTLLGCGPWSCLAEGTWMFGLWGLLGWFALPLFRPQGNYLHLSNKYWRIRKSLDENNENKGGLLINSSIHVIPFSRTMMLLCICATLCVWVYWMITRYKLFADHKNKTWLMCPCF